MPHLGSHLLACTAAAMPSAHCSLKPLTCHRQRIARPYIPALQSNTWWASLREPARRTHAAKTICAPLQVIPTRYFLEWCTDALTSLLSDMKNEVPRGIHTDNLADQYYDILCGKNDDTLSQQMYPQSIWHMFWNSILHVFWHPMRPMLWQVLSELFLKGWLAYSLFLLTYVLTIHLAHAVR